MSILYKFVVFSFVAGALILTLLLVPGCSKTKEVPDPPHVQAQLITELFSALRVQNYALALKKIERLSTLDPEAPYYGTIKNTTENNLVITESQKFLDAGKTNEAITEINKIMDAKGQTVSLLAAVSELKTLQRIKTITDNIAKEENARALAVSTGKLNREIASYPAANSLKEFAGKNLARARSIRSREKEMGLEDLKADIDTAWVQGDQNLDTLIAILEVSSKKSDLSKAYKEAMRKNWETTDPDNSAYITTDNEFIYFRKALANQHVRNSLFNKILKLQPDNFRSLLINSVILKYSGQEKQADSFIKQLNSQFPDTGSLPEKWLQFLPVKTNKINNLNPFVCFPFFIYSNNFNIKNDLSN